MPGQSRGAAGRAVARRLLVVAPNWLGDLIMATPVLDCLAGLRARVEPDLVVTVAVRRRWRVLLDGDPRAQELVSLERTGRHAGWRGLARLAADWRAGRHDEAILLPPSLRVALAARLAGVKVRAGESADGRGPLLTARTPVPPRGSCHYSEQMLRVVDAWAAATGRPRPRDGGAPPLPSLPACAAVAADPRLAGGPPAWALVTGATYGDAKSWPARRAAAFVDRAVADPGARVLLLGDEAARPAAAAIRAASGAPWREDPAGGAGAVDLVGRTRLEEVVALLRGCALFVGTDSGLMHLAAALGVPTLGLFGSTNPAWTAPRGPRAAALAVEGFDCSPCYLRDCPMTTYCLDTLDPDLVLERARSWAAAASAPAGGAERGAGA